MITAAAVTAALVAALAVQFPAADQVQVGTFTQPPTSAVAGFVAVEPPRLTTTTQQREQWTVVDATYTIRSWAPVAAEALATRTSTATALAKQIKVAIETARRGAQPGAALAMLARLTVLEVALGPAADHLPPDWAAADLVVVVRYFTPTGV